MPSLDKGDTLYFMLGVGAGIAFVPSAHVSCFLSLSEFDKFLAVIFGVILDSSVFADIKESHSKPRIRTLIARVV
jgi:hypothetical protein